jgi:membrane associated rhomboid family serine protease
MIPLHDNVPTRRPPLVTIGLIAACVLVFIWQAGHSAAGQEAIAYSLGFVPALLFSDKVLPPELYLLPAPLTVFSAMFLHGGLWHLGGNMLYLWIFGNNVEDAMGHGRFVLFYLLCGLVAALAQALPHPGSEIPMLGASGAVSGVLGAYLLLHPRARVLVLLPLGCIFYTLRLPAMVVLGFWFGLQLLNSLLADPDVPGVAWLAHVGGFVAGMVLIFFFRRRGVRLHLPG